MSYTDLFGSNTVPPAGSGLLVLTLLADQAFCWPSDYNGTLPGVASIIQVSAASGNSLILPDARDQSIGFDFLIRNVGAYPLQVKGNAGTTIGTIPAGGSYYLYLTDNSTAQGVYGLIAFGVGTSSVDASTLVGYGIKAVGISLNQSHPVLTYSGNTTIDSFHRAQLVVFNGGTVTASLTAASSLGNDYFFILKNLGTGTVTIDPAGSETIDGQSAFSVQPGESMVVCCSGSSWYVVGYGRSTVYQFTQLVKDISAGGTINLTSSEASNKLITFTGNPASGVTVVIPSVVSVYYLMSSISTAQSITFKTAAGSGVGIPQSARIIAMCDGVNVVSAQSVQSNSSLSLTDGTSAAPSLSFSSATNTGLYKYGASGVGISISGTPQFTLDGTNLLVPNVRMGIGGTPTGAQRLLVKQAAGDTYTVDLQGSATNTSLRFVNDLNTVERASIVADSSNVLGFRTNGTSRMTIDGSGNTQLGQSAVTAAGGGRFLDIYNTENTSGSSYATLRFITYNNSGGATTSADIIKNKAGAFYFNNNEPTANGYIIWALNSVEKARIGPSGFGIGTSNPQSTLDVFSGGGTLGQFRISTTGAILYAYASGVSGVNGVGIGASFTSGGYGPLIFETSATERMRIDASGNLGIGVTPGGSYKLQVQGSQYNYNASAFTPSNSTVGAAAVVTGGAYGGGLVQVDGATYGATWLQSGSMAWGLGSSAGVLTALTLSSSQLNAKGDEILVGQTGNATQKRMRLQNSARDVYLCLNPDNTVALWDQTTGVNRWYTSTAGDLTVIGNVIVNKDSVTLGAGSAGEKSLIFSNNIRSVNLELSADGSTFRMVDYGASVVRWATNVAGDFTAAGNVTAYSDERLKKDIRTIPNALDSVNRMRGVLFTRNDTGLPGSGVIAQEQELVTPELIVDIGDYKTVAYGNIVGYLIEAVKELANEVRMLKEAH